METFEEPDPSAVGKVRLVEKKAETNQIGSIELTDFEADKKTKNEQE